MKRVIAKQFTSDNVITDSCKAVGSPEYKRKINSLEAELLRLTEVAKTNKQVVPPKLPASPDCKSFRRVRNAMELELESEQRIKTLRLEAAEKAELHRLEMELRIAKAKADLQTTLYEIGLKDEELKARSVIKLVEIKACAEAKTLELEATLQLEKKMRKEKRREKEELRWERLRDEERERRDRKRDEDDYRRANAKEDMYADMAKAKAQMDLTLNAEKIRFEMEEQRNLNKVNNLIKERNVDVGLSASAQAHYIRVMQLKQNETCSKLYLGIPASPDISNKHN